MVWEGGGGGGGAFEASDNHNVSNVKIDTYIITSRLRSIHLNMIWYLDDMAVLFDQATVTVTISESLLKTSSECNEHKFQN